MLINWHQDAVVLLMQAACNPMLIHVVLAVQAAIVRFRVQL